MISAGRWLGEVAEGVKRAVREESVLGPTVVLSTVTYVVVVGTAVSLASHAPTGGIVAIIGAYAVLFVLLVLNLYRSGRPGG
jgi:hypothetical protein